MANISGQIGFPKMRRIVRIHFVGIGGAGMCGIAEVLLHQGYQISGSDIKQSSVTDRLSELGARIALSHDAENIHDVDCVVQSSAIHDTNPEIIAARQARIPVVPRAQMLAELMRFRYGIACAGTHGKTTTTSLVSSILAEGGLDPSYVIGGKLNSAGRNASLGSSEFLVAEADESDASFLHLQPMISVITNIDADHMETYQGDFSLLENTFLKFLHNLPFYGLAVLCLEDTVVRSLLPRISRPVITYGFSDDCDVQALNIVQTGMQNCFQVRRPDSDQLLDVTLNMPGKHNVLNALAAIAIGTELGVSDAAICRALATFAGIGRRMQQYPQIQASCGPVNVIDDYGHHPREIAATLSALRDAWPDKRLVMIFEPHRYTRTRDLFDDFAHVLSQTDLLLMLPVYPAGEEPIAGADSRDLCRSIRSRGKVDPIFIAQRSELVESLQAVLKEGDLILTQGAGSVGQVPSQLLEQLSISE